MSLTDKPATKYDFENTGRMNLGILNGAYPPPGSETPRTLLVNLKMFELVMSSIFPLVALIALSPFAIAVGFLYCAYRGGVYVLGVFADLVSAASVGKNGREIVD